MALRQIDIYLSEDHDELPDIGELGDEYDIIDHRRFRDEDGNPYLRILLETRDTEALLDRLVKEIGDSDSFRIIVQQVATTLPKREESEDEEDDEPTSPARAAAKKRQEEEKKEKQVSRISRQEIYEEVRHSISVSSVHYMLVLLSTIVAAAGMLRDSTAVVIGAMVIAPLIGPNIALALGTTLADFRLLRRALKVNILGLVIALVVSLLGGYFLTVDVTVAEIATRTEINIGDVTLALAAGAAGVLSVTRGVSTALIGVMVAVALLPPLVAVGLLLGSGEAEAAFGAALLTLTNIVAINIAGVLTFLAQNIRPTTWYEAARAKRATIIALALWAAILAILITAIFLASPEAL